MAKCKSNLILLLLINLLMLNSCSLFSDTLRLEVPVGYTGWCYVIPVSSNLPTSPVTDGKYQVDSNGVVLIPASVFDVKKDHLVKVYEGGKDISDDMRYAGSVRRSNSTDTMKYQYIHFYLPSADERAIPDATQYWRDKMYEYRKTGDKGFDSLLKAGRIAFQTEKDVTK